MLVEALVFSLFSGSAALLGAYRVFSEDPAVDVLRAKVLQTTFLGLVPAVVGFILAVPSVEAGSTGGAHAVHRRRWRRCLTERAARSDGRRRSCGCDGTVVACDAAAGPLRHPQPTRRDDGVVACRSE